MTIFKKSLDNKIRKELDQTWFKQINLNFIRCYGIEIKQLKNATRWQVDKEKLKGQKYVILFEINQFQILWKHMVSTRNIKKANLYVIVSSKQLRFLVIRYMSEDCINDGKIETKKYNLTRVRCSNSSNRRLIMEKN